MARWRWWAHLVLIGGYFLPLTILRRARPGPILTNQSAGLLLVSAFDILFFAVIYGVAVLISRATRDDLFLRWRPGAWVIPLGLLYSIVIRLAVGLIVAVVAIVVVLLAGMSSAEMQHFMTVLRPKFEHVVNVQTMQSNRSFYWLMITLISFVNAGLREELWRVGTLAGLTALFPRAFGAATGQIWAMALIAIVFGLGHIAYGLLGACMAGLLGFLLGLIIIRHRSVWPAVFAHGFLDATTFAALPFIAHHLPGG